MACRCHHRTANGGRRHVLVARRIRFKADRAAVESHRRCASYDLKLDNLLITGAEPSDDKLCPVAALRSQ
jgi:hypothetical protein